MKAAYLFLVLLLLLVIAVPVQQSKAAVNPSTLTQPVQCNMTSGGTQATLTLTDSGGSVSPSTLSCNGALVKLTVTNSTTLTATEPADSTTSRFRFSSGQSSITLNVCANDGCTTTWTISNYMQWDVSASYTLVGGGSPTAPSFSCDSLGSATSQTLSTSATTIYVDNGCTWNVNPTQLTGSSSSERWQTQSSTSGTVSSSLTVDPLFYHQYSFSAGYTVSGGGSANAPTLTSTQFGSSSSLTLTTSFQSSWLDSGSTWTVSSQTPGSTSAERWENSGVDSGTVSSASSITFTYYHQYNIPFAFSVAGGGSGYSAPSLTYKSLGASSQASLSSTSTAHWMDAGSSWVASSPLAGSSSNERWSSKVTSGTASSAGAVTVSYYHQYLLSASYTPAGGGGGYAPPTLTFTSFAISSSSDFSQGPFWADSGSSWSTVSSLSGGSAQQRWETSAVTSGSVTSPTVLTFVYYHQYYVTFNYTVVGGGSGYGAPSATISQFGSQVSALSGWADAGTGYSLTNPLSGSSAGERWYTASAQGTVSSALTVQAEYYHQFDLTMSYAVVGTASQVPPPTLNSTALGQPFISNLRTTPADHWLDSGAGWTVSAQLPGSGADERWMTNQPTSGTALVGTASVTTFYEQYAAGFDYTPKGGAPPSAPALNYTSFSTAKTASLNSSRVVYWLDSGSNWSLTDPIPGKNAFERWLADTTTSGLATSSFNESVVYTHQYYLSLTPNVKDGGTIEVPSDWHDSGTSVNLNVTASAGWKFFGWDGQGTGSYTGSSPGQSVTFGSSINETAIFYAGLSMTASNGGSVGYRYSESNGTVSPGGAATIYVDPGTSVNLTATPSTVEYLFSGWSGKLAGTNVNETLTVAAPASVSAAFGLDYTDIGVFYALTVVVMVAAAFVFIVRRRHLAFHSDQLAPSSG